MLAILTSPEIQGAIATLILAILVAITAWVKKDASQKDETVSKDKYEEIVSELSNISATLKGIAEDIHDHTTIIKYTKSQDRGG